MKLNLSITAENITNFEESRCIIQEYNPILSEFEEIGRTSQVITSDQKRWQGTIPLVYHFNHKQILRFSITDMLNNPQYHKDTTLGSLLQSKPFKLNFGNLSKKLILTINEEKQEENFIFQFIAQKVDKKDLFGKSDPYFIIYKMTQQGWTEIYKSEVKKNTLFPVWAEFSLKSHELGTIYCDVALRIEVWDWDRNTKNDFIGVASVNLNQIFMPGAEFELINEKKLKKSKYRNSGTLKINKAVIERNYSIVDFLQSGNKFEFNVAVDFSENNGNFVNKSSMHYAGRGIVTVYERFIEEFGGIFESFSRERWLGLYGIGACEFRGQSVSEHFDLLPQDQSTINLENLIHIYRSSIPLIVSSQSSNLSSLLNHLTSTAANSGSGQTYSVFLFLICSTIQDISESKSLFSSVINLPISLIFIELGKFMRNNPEDFYIPDAKNIHFFRLKDHHNDIKGIVRTALNSIKIHVESLN